jgi:hypothetical protein
MPSRDSGISSDTFASNSNQSTSPDGETSKSPGNPAGGLAADCDKLVGAVKIEEADFAEARIDDDVRGVASFGFVVLKGREDLVFDPQPRLDPHLLDVDFDDVVRFRSLTNAMTDAYRRLTGPEPSAAALADYTRLTGDQTIADAHRETGLFNLPR